MCENLLKVFEEFGDNFAIQDDSILINDIIYHFTKKMIKIFIKVYLRVMISSDMLYFGT
jgi:hypothetical protein